MAGLPLQGRRPLRQQQARPAVGVGDPALAGRRQGGDEGLRGGHAAQDLHGEEILGGE